MSDSAGSDAAERRRRRRSRRGLFARLGHWFGLGGEVRDAAVALLRAEARLARAALPRLLVWLAVVSIGGVLFLATLWGGALLLLYRWTGSIGLSLLWLGAISLVVLAVALVFLRRMVRAASFSESRRRVVFWLERSEAHEPAEQPAE